MFHNIDVLGTGSELGCLGFTLKRLVMLNVCAVDKQRDSKRLTVSPLVNKMPSKQVMEYKYLDYRV